MNPHRAISIFILITAALLGGCGGSDKQIGGVGALPPASVAGRVNLSGTLLAPAGIDGVARMAAQGNSWQSQVVANAEVALYTMDASGNLVLLGDTYKTMTDAAGNFTLYYVPPINNVIIMGKKDVTVNGQPKKLKLKRFLSILQRQTQTGVVSDVIVDAASSLAVAAMKDILATANANLAPDAQITAADLPADTLADLQTSMEAALAADQASGSPAVDLDALTAGDTTEADATAAAQLDALLATPAGANVATAINDVVEVVAGPIPEPTPEPTAVADVTGTVTSGGQPVADAVVAIYNDTYSDATVTGATGVYNFYNVPAGTYYIVATKDNFTLESQTVVVQ